MVKTSCDVRKKKGLERKDLATCFWIPQNVQKESAHYDFFFFRADFLRRKCSKSTKPIEGRPSISSGFDAPEKRAFRRSTSNASLRAAGERLRKNSSLFFPCRSFTRHRPLPENTFIQSTRFSPPETMKRGKIKLIQLLTTRSSFEDTRSLIHNTKRRRQDTSSRSPLINLSLKKIAKRYYIELNISGKRVFEEQAEKDLRLIY